MANPKNIFKTATVRVQNSSPFDMSHRNLLTTKVGQLTPVLTEVVMPGDKIRLSQKFRAQLPPMASNFLGSVKIRMNAFFVPNRLLVGGWKDYMMYSQGLATGFIPEGMPKYYVPKVIVTAAKAGLGSLADYIGIKQRSIPLAGASFESLPFLAYHRIFSDWYRQPNVQKDCFIHSSSGVISSAESRTFAQSSPYVVFTTPHKFQADSLMNDGVGLLSLRQVNYPKDYFTNAYVNQNGGASPMKVRVSTDSLTIHKIDAHAASNALIDAGGHLTEDGSSNYNWNIYNSDGSQLTFSIPQLRAANTLQRFAENNSIAGGRYPDTIQVNYGVRPSDALCDRAVYLGGFSSEVYNNSVASTANGSTIVQNGFTNRVGGTGAVSMAFGDDSLVDNFEVKEHGIFMVLCDIVPYANYSSGTRRQWIAPVVDGENFVDRFCVPSLSSLGNQPIYSAEISDTVNAADKAIFGYTDRYGHFKWHDDEVHGLLAQGGSLSFMAAQRFITGAATIGSSFLQVKSTDLDNVTAVSADLSNYGVTIDLLNSLHMVRPLPIYSIPTLCDDVNTHSINVERNGTRL